jgi:hypothetical protein
MNKETLRMQMLAGVITESQYKTKLKKFTISETMIYADYANDGGAPVVKFARVLADNVMAGYDNGTIEGLYGEEIDEDGDDFYASMIQSINVFKSLPNTFTVTAELVDEEPFTFKVTKNGESGYSAEEI